MSDITTRKPIICVIGKSGVGKDTIVNGACAETGWKPVLSYTTRPKRVGEGNTHIFITPEEAAEVRKRAIAYTKFGEYEYMVTEDGLQDADFYIIDPIGFKMMCEDEKLSAKYRFVPVEIWLSDNEQRERLIGRGDDEAVYKKRMMAEEARFADFADMCGKVESAYCIHNVRLQESIDQLIRITNKEKQI